MKDWHNAETDRLCNVIKELKTKEECYAFLDDICTIKEVLDISQRLSVAQLIDQGKSYQEIEKETGASSATISRIYKCYEYGAGGYKIALEKLKS